MKLHFFKTSSKFTLLAGVLFIVLSAANAQPLKYGDQNIGIGIGVPAINNYNYSSLSPAFSASYEYGFSDKIGIGYIGGGAMLSFAGSRDVFYQYNEKYTAKYNYFLIGPRAAYHFDMADITGNRFWDKCDLYAGVYMGLRFETYKYDAPGSSADYEESATNLSSDLFAGIRYAFTPQFGVFAEVGEGVNYFTVGVGWRL